MEEGEYGVAPASVREGASWMAEIQLMDDGVHLAYIGNYIFIHDFTSSCQSSCRADGTSAIAPFWVWGMHMELKGLH